MEKREQEYRYRSAITGEYVTEEYATLNPDTTVSEEVKDESEKEEDTKGGIFGVDTDLERLTY